MTTFHNHGRRRFLKTATSSLLVPAFGLGAGKALAAQDKVVIGTWGGDYENFLRKAIEPLVGDMEVLYNVSNATQRLTRVLAERKSRRTSMDIAMLSDFDMYRAYENEGLLPVDELDIPNMANVYEQFRFSYAVPHIFSSMVLVYNTEAVKTPPDSFGAALEPEFKGKVGFSDILYAFNTLFAGLAEGGDGKSFDKGIAFLRKLKANSPRVYPSNEAVAAAFKSGDIVMSCMWKARAQQWRQDGLPLEFVVPKEGAIPFDSLAAPVRKIRNKKAVGRYLNALLEPSAQQFFAEHMGYAPTVKNAGLSPELQKRVGFTDEELARMKAYDVANLNATMSTCVDFWTKEFKPGL